MSAGIGKFSPMLPSFGFHFAVQLQNKKEIFPLRVRKQLIHHGGVVPEQISSVNRICFSSGRKLSAYRVESAILPVREDGTHQIISGACTERVFSQRSFNSKKACDSRKTQGPVLFVKVVKAIVLNQEHGIAKPGGSFSNRLRCLSFKIAMKKGTIATTVVSRRRPYTKEFSQAATRISWLEGSLTSSPSSSSLEIRI